MIKLSDFLKLAWQPKEVILGFCSYIPRRGARYRANIKWVKPDKRKPYDPVRSGDLVGMPVLNSDSPYLLFKNSKELETADEKVRKIFSLGYQKEKCKMEMYQHELAEKVKSHAYESDSKEVAIANLTARIRYYYATFKDKPSKYPGLRCLTHTLIRKRYKLLAELRQEDYKKFEWLLDKLNLEFRLKVPKEQGTVTREKSLELLAKLSVKQTKEERLAALKKEYDDQKLEFLKKKIMKLKEIKQIEEKNNMSITVTEKDIEDCINNMEKVKIKIAERAERGYKRKIHPYFLEAFDEKLLWETEKAGEYIREQQFCLQNKASEN